MIKMFTSLLFGDGLGIELFGKGGGDIGVWGVYRREGDYPRSAMLTLVTCLPRMAMTASCETSKDIC